MTEIVWEIIGMEIVRNLNLAHTNINLIVSKNV